MTAKIKLFYGVGEVGNAMVNSAISFFLLVFLTDAALVAPAPAGSALLVLLLARPLLIWYPITRETHAEVLEKLEVMEAEA